MRKRIGQLALGLPAPPPRWGGRRPGAGRKRGAPGAAPHVARGPLGGRYPLHVTLRTRPGIPSLRRPPCWPVIALALRAVEGRRDFAIVHFSVQATHLHLVVEADDARAVANGVRALTARIAVGLNRALGTAGPVFPERYHARPLRTPAEVRNAVGYAVRNLQSHAARRGRPLHFRVVDPCSSQAPRLADGLPAPVAEPRTWLLRTGPLLAREPVADWAA